MKIQLLSLVFGLSLMGSLAQAGLCGKYLPCGSFKGAMTYEKDTQTALAIESLKLSEGKTADTLVIEGELKSLDGQPLWNYSFVMKFTEDGSFQILIPEDQTVVGVGLCDTALCTYALRPMSNFSTAGSLYAKDGVLYRTHSNKEGDDRFITFVSKMSKQ